MKIPFATILGVTSSARTKLRIEAFLLHLIDAHRKADRSIRCSKKGCIFRSLFPDTIQKHEQKGVHFMLNRYQDTGAVDAYPIVMN